LQTAIDQLNYCHYECEGGPLRNNVAWQWLIKFAAHQSAASGAGEFLELNPVNPPHIQRIPVLGEAYTKADVIKAMEAFAAQQSAELERVREAADKLMPYIHEDGMKGETDFEKAVLALEAALAPAPPKEEK
jgi:hypothetical protein